MTNEEAKQILSACRPGGQDAGDPSISGALQHARNDPTLAAWFEREQAHSAVIAAKLREVAPPPGLREWPSCSSSARRAIRSSCAS